MIVAEPSSGRGNTEGEHLFLWRVNCFVLNGKFGLQNATCGEQTAAGWEVLALTALSPGGGGGRGTVVSNRNQTIQPVVSETQDTFLEWYWGSCRSSLWGGGGLWRWLWWTSPGPEPAPPLPVDRGRSVSWNQEELTHPGSSPYSESLVNICLI